MLYPNCSEYVCHLSIKKEELPYIKKRVEELMKGEEDRKYLLEHFTKWVDKEDDSFIGSFISSEEVEPYNTIKGELLVKRNKNVCPFCKEKVEHIFSHIKEFHKEELKLVLGGTEEYEKQ